MNLAMYRGASLTLAVGPVLIDGAPPAVGDMEGLALLIADDPDNPGFIPAAISGAITNAPAWEGTITIEPADTASLPASAGGTLYYYTILAYNESSGDVFYTFPRDEDGKPAIGVLLLYESLDP